MKWPIITITILSFFVASVSAGKFTKQLTKGQTSPAASIKQISWIAGTWRGKAFGGEVEEIWSKPLAGSMMATFRMIKDGQVKFYEIEIIRERNNSLVLELKHFNNDLKGWEEKNEVVEFPLVELNDSNVYFAGMTFKKIGDNEMHVYVDIEDKGKHSEVLFAYKRAK